MSDFILVITDFLSEIITFEPFLYCIGAFAVFSTVKLILKLVYG